MKDGEGYRAVFTRKGAPASWMAAARLLDTVAKLPGMIGEVSDAVSAYTQVEMSEARRLLRLPAEECLAMWIRLHPQQQRKSWDNIDDPVFTLERNPFGHPFRERTLDGMLIVN